MQARELFGRYGVPGAMGRAWRVGRVGRVARGSRGPRGSRGAWVAWGNAKTQNARAMAGVRIKQNARAMAGVSVSDDQRQNRHDAKRDDVDCFFGHVMRPPARAWRWRMIWRGPTAPTLI